MAKTVLSAEQQFDLRQALHVAVLEALLAARRWEPGELAFQGGTSLHLVHGSPRFSEDLDFLVKSGLKLDTISGAIERRLQGLAWLPKGSDLKVSSAKDEHNPHAFVVSLTGKSFIGGVRVKVELWQVQQTALEPLRIGVHQVRANAGPAAGAQAFVPAVELEEIYVDKVFALAARRYLKPRDVFDLHWIKQQTPPPGAPAFNMTCTPESLSARLAAYPNTSASDWLAGAELRLEELGNAAAAVEADLRRWLPSSWPLSGAQVRAMLDSSAAALRQGMAVMRAMEDESRPEVESLSEDPQDQGRDRKREGAPRP